MPQTWNHGISDEILDGIFAEEDTKNGRERKKKAWKNSSIEDNLQIWEFTIYEQKFKMFVPKTKTNLNKGK